MQKKNQEPRIKISNPQRPWNRFTDFFQTYPLVSGFRVSWLGLAGSLDSGFDYMIKK